jgi:methionyl-tRNA synthetase
MDAFLNQADPGSVPVFAAVILWSIFWKGLALWQASRRDQRLWFVILLVVSTLGILEIIYLFFVIKMKPGELFGSTGKSKSLTNSSDSSDIEKE